VNKPKQKNPFLYFKHIIFIVKLSDEVRKLLNDIPLAAQHSGSQASLSNIPILMS